MYSKNMIPLLEKLQRVSLISDHRALLTTLLTGVKNTSNYKASLMTMDITLTGGKSKPRNVIQYDDNDEVTIEQESIVMADDSTYIASAVNIINMYLGSIDQSNPNNKYKVLSLMIKLFSLNLGVFYNKLDIDKHYSELTKSVLDKIMDAEMNVLDRLEEILVSRVWIEERRLHGIPEVGNKSPDFIYNTFIDVPRSNPGEKVGSYKKFIDSLGFNLDEESVNTEAVLEVDDPFEETIKILETNGIGMVLRSRIDKFMNTNLLFLKNYNDFAFDNLKTILGRFKDIYNRVTLNVDISNYQKMFGIAGSTYRPNISKVVRELHEMPVNGIKDVENLLLL